MPRSLHWLLALLALGALACRKDRTHDDPAGAAATPPASAPLVAAPVVPDDPQTCAACHGAIVAEYTESMHAQAHHAADPIYGAMRSLRLGKEGPQLSAACARCHTPRDLADAESAVAKTGVGCATCHNLASVELSAELRGVEALRFDAPGMLRGPHDVPAGKAVVHGTGPAQPALVDGKTVCLACHGEERNPQGLPTCTTGVEHGDDERSCTSCHMPEVAAPSGVVSTRATHRSHAFLGPHRAWHGGEIAWLAEHLTVSGRFEQQRVVALIDNRAAHGFPTGFPARLAMLAMTGFDAGGARVWSNFDKDPIKDHPEAVFGKAYVDAEGKPTLAPYATKMVRDHRVQRLEKRELANAVPAAVVRVELELKLWLVAPPAAQKLGLSGPLTEPRVLAKATVVR